VTAEGDEYPFDLFLGVPKHCAPPVVLDSGLCVDGWIPVDPGTLETAYPGVYAVGDVTSVGTPKAGVFAERQAAVVAEEIIARTSGGKFEPYDGRGICYVEFGHDQVARVDVSFLPGQAPTGDFDEACDALAADKAEFGTSRIKRWFGRDWSAY
jgi:sulfide:quinone oxidoreductase